MLTIFKFLVIILFGKSQAYAEIPECHKGCNADNWGINEVTSKYGCCCSNYGMCIIYETLSTDRPSYATSYPLTPSSRQ